MTRNRELEIRAPQELADEYYGLFDEGVPMDLSPQNLLLIGLKALLGHTGSEITPARTPTMELGARKMELAKLEQALAEKSTSRDEQLRILDQHLRDKASVERALTVLERRIIDLQKRLDIDLGRPLRGPAEGTP